MKKRKKLSTIRVSVTLPELMVEDFKTKADLTGLSVSRIVHLQLKARKPIMIVSREFLNEVRELRQVLDKIVAEGTIEAETLSILRQRVQFYQAFITSDQEVDVYVP
ncbi:hypothetical protein KL86SPO_50345 [uncultured Sporomusa sp.]|uniref:Uncharacterized protein n=1 Tax=uncultured Sporomusa sp. TaxID=307249 RepID=A0A212LYA1_9FIRM|nr:hypothetical protein [uncultured Sporomusa sp.]SCM82574.1 hypothetical protein KL86SPO_50345 [uncultured Sporomusa sp.]